MPSKKAGWSNGPGELAFYPGNNFSPQNKLKFKKSAYCKFSPVMLWMTQLLLSLAYLRRVAPSAGPYAMLNLRSYLAVTLLLVFYFQIALVKIVQ